MHSVTGSQNAEGYNVQSSYTLPGGITYKISLYTSIKNENESSKLTIVKYTNAVWTDDVTYNVDARVPLETLKSIIGMEKMPDGRAYVVFHTATGKLKLALKAEYSVEPGKTYMRNRDLETLPNIYHFTCNDDPTVQAILDLKSSNPKTITIKRRDTMIMKFNITQNIDSIANSIEYTMNSLRFEGTTTLVINGINLSGTTINSLERNNQQFTITVVASQQFTGGASSSIHVLGRSRQVKRVGRKSMVTYKGKLISLTEARAIEKKLKSKR